MNSNEPSPNPQPQPSPALPPITLHINGNVIPFKNRRKAAIHNRTKKLMTYTEPKIKQHMQEITRSFVSQLSSAIQDGATATGVSPQSAIVSCLPFDDSLAWIPEIIVMAEHVETGKEETIITIKRI